jgi:hypothetical protein
MYPEPTTRRIEHLNKPGVMPDEEPDIGTPIDDPSVGDPTDPSRRDPSEPEVDGPTEPMHAPSEWPDAPPAPLPSRYPDPAVTG